MGEEVVGVVKNWRGAGRKPGTGGGVHERNRVRLLCVETGELYHSMLEAAVAVDRTPAAITMAARDGTVCAGFHWKKLERGVR